MPAIEAKTHYPPAAVAAATGISVEVQNRYFSRSTIIPSRNDKKPSGSGDWRLMGIETVYQLAITATLTRLGISAKRAGQAAREFTDSPGNRRPASGLYPVGLTLLCLRPSGPVVFNALFDADFATLSDHGMGFVAIDCGRICSTVDNILTNHCRK